MPAKGTIQANHISMNKFSLVVTALPPFTIITVSGLEEELETVDLPDRTKASGGNRKPLEFEVKTPMHHTVEQAAWEVWYRESQDPVSSTYKKTATLLCYAISGNLSRVYTLTGVFPSKRAVSEWDMENEGEMATVTWTLQADEMRTPIPATP